MRPNRLAAWCRRRRFLADRRCWCVRSTRRALPGNRVPQKSPSGCWSGWRENAAYNGKSPARSGPCRAYRLVRLAGIEPTTPWFVAKYSIQLSYSREARKYSAALWLFLGIPCVNPEPGSLACVAEAGAGVGHAAAFAGQAAFALCRRFPRIVLRRLHFDGALLGCMVGGAWLFLAFRACLCTGRQREPGASSDGKHGQSKH